jgi:hypothetical protein
MTSTREEGGSHGTEVVSDRSFLWLRRGIGKTVAASLHQQGRPYPVIGRSEGTLEKTFGSDPRAEVAVWDVRPVRGHEFVAETLV